MFHRVDDPEAIGAARYFQLAELLPAYDGVMRAIADRDRRQHEPADPYAAGMAAPDMGVAYAAGPSPAPPVTDDVAGLAAMSQHSGFPGIEYQGG